MEQRILKSLLPGRSYLILGNLVQATLPISFFPEIDRLIFDTKTGDVKSLRALIAQTQLAAVSESRLLLIIDAHLLSEVMQNTLLKLLEEPPSQLVVVLQAKQDNHFLPTVLSRLHRLPSVTEETAYTQSLFGHSAQGLFEQLADEPRDQLIEKLTSELSLARNTLLDNPSGSLARNVFLLDQTVKKLNQNCNQKLTIDRLLLQWYDQSGYMSN